MAGVPGICKPENDNNGEGDESAEKDLRAEESSQSAMADPLSLPK